VFLKAYAYHVATFVDDLESIRVQWYTRKVIFCLKISSYKWDAGSAGNSGVVSHGLIMKNCITIFQHHGSPWMVESFVMVKSCHSRLFLLIRTSVTISEALSKLWKMDNLLFSVFISGIERFYSKKQSFIMVKTSDCKLFLLMED
jgi:hypothetical protein